MKLSIKFANGTEKTVDLGPEGLKLAAQPGATYHLIDERTMKTPVKASVKRVQGDLQIDGGDANAASVHITGFFDDCTPSDRCWATFDAPVDGGAGMPTATAAGNGTPPFSGSTVVITQDGQSLGALQGGHVGGMVDGQTLSFASHDDMAGWGMFAGVFAGAAGMVGAGGSVVAAVAPVAAGAAVLATPATDVHPLVVKGTIAAGPVMTGTVEVSVYDKDGNLLGKGLVDSDKGTYEISIAGKGGYTGPILLVARDVNSTGGNYLDEATGKLADLGLSLGAIGVATSPTDLLVINITPITQLATLQMGIDVNAADATFVPPSNTAMIATVNAAVGRFFGVADILGAVVTINDVDFRTSSTDAQAYGVALARLSKLDESSGSAGATINWLVQMLAMAGDDMTTLDANLNTLGSSRTIARLADLVAAQERGDVTIVSHVNLTNVAMVELVFALPVNAQVGDLVHATLAGPTASVGVAVYTITAADLLNGYVTVPVSPVQLAAAGTGNVTPTAVVTDAAGENTSPVITSQSFLSDVTPPDPVVSVGGVHGNVITAADTTVAIKVAYDDVQAGDVIVLTLDGATLGQPHVVTQFEAATRVVELMIARQALGADGAKLISASVLDIGGNTGVAAEVAVALDTTVPAPVIAIKAGQDATLSAGETGVDFDVHYADMAVGDTVQLTVAGSPSGVAHVVTAAEVASGVITVTLAKDALGDPGSKDVSVVVTDTAGNAGAGPAVAVTVDEPATPTPPVVPVDPVTPVTPVTPVDPPVDPVPPVVGPTPVPTPIPAPPSPVVGIKAGQDSYINGNETGIDLQLTYAAAAGDRVQLWLDGVALGAAHVVTAAEATVGTIEIRVPTSSLGTDGLKHVTTQVTDAYSQIGSSAALALTLDTVAPTPSLTVRAGETAHLGLGDNDVHLQVAFPGMSVGDVVRLQVGGVPLGAAHVVDASDLFAGSVTFDVTRASLGADGLKLVMAVATDAAGNVGNSAALPIAVDTLASSPTLTLGAGESPNLGAAQSQVHIVVSDRTWSVGDVVVVRADGDLIVPIYFVTANDVAAGSVTFAIARSDLGADGVKVVVATVVDASGNSGNSPALPLMLDTVAPSAIALSLAAGEDTLLNATETGVHLNVGYAGMVAGDVVMLNLNGSAFGTPHVVTSAEAAAGTLTLDVTKASLGVDGVKNITAIITDAAGNAGTSPALPLTVDTTGPTSVALSIAAGEDSFINAAETGVHLNVGWSGMVAGDVVALNLNGSPLGTPHVVTTAEAAGGTLVLAIDKAALGVDGLKYVTASVVDAAGNTGSSPALPLTLDTTGPSSVTLSVGVGEDGYLGAGETSLHLNVGYAGLAAGDVIALTLAGTPLAAPHVVTAAEATAGMVVLAIAKSSLGADGVKQIVADVTDAAGNTGHSPALPITLDSVAPTPALEVRPGEDSHLGLGETTVHLQVSYAGMVEGDSVTLQLAGQPLGASHIVSAADLYAGRVTFDVTRASLGADGVKSITAVATDAAGNIGTSSALPLTVDTLVSVPTLSLGAGELPDIGAAQSGVHITVADGSLAVGDVIRLQIGGTLLAPAYTVTSTDVATGGVTFAVDRSSLGADGIKLITATVTDLAHNTGTSPVLPLTLDSVAPASVSLAIAAGEDAYLNATETGVHLNVGYVGMVAGDVVALNLGGSILGVAHVVTAAEAAAGVVVLDVSRTRLAGGSGDGVKNITATVTDAAGNAGTSAVLPLTLDGIAPTGVSLAIASNEDNHLGAAESSVHLNVAYTGMAAGDAIALTVGGAGLGLPHLVTAAEATAGRVVLDVSRTSLGADGVKSVVATVTDAAGNAGTSPALALTLDSVAPSSVTLALAAGEDDLIGLAESGAHLNLGYVGMTAGDVVQLSLGGSPLGSPHVVSSGEALAGTIVLTVSRASLGLDGVKNITATVTDAAGNAGTSPVLPLTLDTDAPSTVSLAVAGGEDTFLGVNETDVHLNLGYVGMTAGDVVQLKLGTSTLGTPHVVTAAEALANTVVLDITKASLGVDGVKNITAVVTDAAGNAGTSGVLPLTVDTVAPSAVSLVIAAGDDSYLNASETSVHLNVGYTGMVAGDVVQLNLGGSALGTPHVVTAGEATSNTIVLEVDRASLGADGVKNITATVTDAAGNAGTSGALPVTLDTATPAPTLNVRPGEDDHIGLGETAVHLQVAYVGMAEGDTVELLLVGGGNLSSLNVAHVVTAADLHAGSIGFDVLRVDLGADGMKNVMAVATDLAGNVGTSASLSLLVDSLVAAPSLSLGAGESQLLGLATNDVHLTVSYGNMTVGDVVQLKLGTSTFGSPHVVDSTDVTAGGVTFDITRSSLGADGIKRFTADVTDASSNTGTSPELPLTLDSDAPASVTLAVGAGEDGYLGANESEVHLDIGYIGMVAGDVVALQLGGSPFGAGHVVTAAEALAGVVTLDISRATLGGDGVKNITAVVTDAAGNTGVSPVLPLTLDSIAPTSVTLAVGPGEDALLNANETLVHLQVGYAGMVAGDVIALGLNGSPLGSTHAVSSAEALAGIATLDVTRASLGADGVKNVVATVTDAAGNAGTSAALPLIVDTSAPSSVTLAVAPGDDAFINANEAGVHLNIGYAGMTAGDVIALNYGSPHVVTSAEALAGLVNVELTRASLGSDGIKSVVATVTDAAGNFGNSTPLALTLDTAAPTPTLAPANGQDAIINAAENHLDVVVADPSLHAGDVVQLKLDGVALGASHIVTGTEANAGSVAFTIAKADLGADGTKQLVAVATDTAGNVGSSSALAIVLDTSLPQVAFSDGTGSLLAGAGAGVLGAGHAGVSLVDASSVITDGGTVAIGSLSVALAGFVDGASEQITLGGQTLSADGSNAPATVNVAGRTWSVAYSSASHAYTFTAVGSPATAAQAAALMQATYNDNAATITDGQRVLTYVLTDADGNPGNAVTASVIVSTTPPAIAPTITALGNDTGTAGDFITTVAAQTVFGTFTGQSRTGDRIQVSTDGSTWTDATIYAAGSFYANGIMLQAGTHDLSVRAVDSQGNARVPTTQAYTLDNAVITTTASIGQVIDDVSFLGSVTGPVTSGVSTDDTTPTLHGVLTGTLASGQVVAVYDTLNGVVSRLGEAVVNGTAWSFTSGALVAGQHNLSVLVEKPASGASSAASAVFVLDEQTITFGVYDRVGNVQGQLMQGGITDDSHPTIVGTLAAAPLGVGEVVAVYDGATRLGNATVSGTSFSYTPGSVLGDGSHTLVAMIEDNTTGTALNGRVVGTPLQFTVDTTTLAPTQAATITLVSEGTATNTSVTGPIASGTSTDGTTPTLTGTLSAALAANQQVSIWDTVGGVTTRLGTASVASTNWTFTSPALGVGSHSLSAVVENAATGLQGPASAAFTLIEQTVQLTSISDDVGVSVGFVMNNGITDDATPTLSGTLGTAALGSGEAVVVYDGATRLGVATVDGTSWTYTPTALLLDGVHTFRAMVEDATTGTATTGRVVSGTMVVTTVTSTQVPTETITSITATESTVTNGSVSGAFASGTSTDGTTPTFAGTLSAQLGLGEAVAVYDTTGGVTTRLGYATANGTSWNYASTALAVGNHSITARVENIFGASGTASSPFIVIEQRLVVTGLVDDVGTTQGPIASGGATDDNTPTLTGTLGTALGAGEVVAVYDGAVKLGNATVTGSNWAYTPAALTDGAHSLRAVVQDSASSTVANGRLVSTSTAFTLNTSAAVPTQTANIVSVTESTTINDSVSGAFASGTSTDGRTPTLNGSLSATLGNGQVLAIYDGATRLGTATVNGTAWTYTTPVLAIGSNSLTAVVENPATGAHGTASAAFVVIEQSLAIDSLLGLTGAANVLVGGIATVVLPTAPQLSGTLGSATIGANEVVAIYDGGTKLGNAVLNGNAWGFATANSGLITGFHTVTAMIQDASTVDPSTGRVVAQSTSFTINASLLVPTATPQITYGIESTATNGSKIGGFASSETIDSQTPTIGGTVNSTLDSSQVLAVYDGFTKLGNATVVGQSWSFTTPVLAYGAHSLTAQVENINTGSHGTASAAYVVKTQSLSAITVTDDQGAIFGTVANGGVTDDKFLTFSGTLGAANILDLSLETISIYDTYNGVRMKIGDAAVNGATWSFTPTSLNLLFGMQNGVHSVNAVIEPLLSQTNADDRVVSATSTFTVDSTTTPTQLVAINTVTDGQGAGHSQTGAVGGLSTIDDTTPIFTGALSASLTGAQKVAVYDNVGGVTTKLGYATIDATNPLKWTFEPAAAMASGNHIVTADVENTASGAQGPMSTGFVFTERPVTLHVADDQGALQGDVLAFGNGGVTDDTTVVLSGTIGTPLALGGLFNLLESVQVYDNGVSKGAATVSGTNWSMTLSNLSVGTHDLIVSINPLVGSPTVATEGIIKVQASDLLSVTSDASYSSTALAAKFTLGSGSALDLTRVSGAAQPHMDVIDMGTSNGTLKLALADVLTGNVNSFTNANGWSGITGSGRSQIVVDGSVGTVTMTDGTWSTAGTATHAGHTYNVYEDSNHLAQLLVESHLTRTGPIAG